MMLQEFIDRTGFEPTSDEYEQIQQEYYKFDGDKDAYCKAFVEGGGLARLAKARKTRIEQLDGRILEMEHEVERQTKELRKEVKRLTAALDKECEWKPYEAAENVPQARYAELARCADGGRCAHYMTDDEAKSWIYDEFGFDPAKVKVLHEVAVIEKDRHNRLRKTGKTYDRRPVYCATDYQYIRFNVGAWAYECWNDELHKFYE